MLIANETGPELLGPPGPGIAAFPFSAHSSPEVFSSWVEREMFTVLYLHMFQLLALEMWTPSPPEGPGRIQRTRLRSTVTTRVGSW